MTQCEQVLNFMQKYGSISNREAVAHLCIYRLSARIHELRLKGWQIENIVCKNSQTGSRFVRYYITGGADERN